MPITADKRGYVAGKFALDLDGASAGWIQSVEGGQASADVVVEKVGPDHIAKKHLAGVKYDDISISCGTGMSKAFYEWIKSSFDHNYQRKGGAVITCDYNYKELARMTWYNGLITEIGFPALDAASKDAAKMSIKVTPETTRVATGQGASVAGGKYSLGKGEQKKWTPANFRLRIDGTDCTRVNKIDALVVKQKVIQNQVGELRDYETEPASVEIPNLVITVNESHAKEFFDWHQDFVINGNNGQDKERGGTLEFLAPNLHDTLFTLTFQQLGIFKITPDKVEAGSENIRRVKVEMYCEDISFQYTNAAWA